MKNYKNQEQNQKEVTQSVNPKGKRSRGGLTETQDRILGGFAKTLNSRLSEPTLLQQLVKKVSFGVAQKATVNYAGFGSVSLSSDLMNSISEKNKHEIIALDDKTTKKRLVTGLFKPAAVTESRKSILEKGLKNSNLEVGEVVVINGRSFKKTK